MGHREPFCIRTARAELSVNVADGRTEGRTDAVAATRAAVGLPVMTFESQPPSYKTAASSTQAAAPRPTAIRIAVSGFCGVVVVDISGSWLKACTGSGSTARSAAIGAATWSHREGSACTGSGCGSH